LNVAFIGERGVMKTKIFGLALMLSLATMLGACETNSAPTGNTTPAATPAAGEPADTGSTPAATTTPEATPAATTTPEATPAATPN
jgi:hypothetical protein